MKQPKPAAGKLDARTLRWASANARKRATNSRRLQMTATPDQAPAFRLKANVLDELADALLFKAQAIESRAAEKGRKK
jgi:hypothetical protein